MLGPSQLTTVGRAIIVAFFVDCGFATFEVSGFACGQLAALHALGNPFLLIALTLSNFGLGIGVLYPRIVLVAVNILGDSVLLLMQGCAVGAGQMAIVQLAHVAFFVVDLGFLGLEMYGFARSQLAALDAVGNAVLLVFL